MKLETIYKCYLSTLIKNRPTSWFKNFVIKHPHLYKWILDKTHLLTIQKFDFKINTRVNWVLNDICDFPKCYYCNEYIETWKHKNIPVTHKYPRYCLKHAHCNDESRNKIKNTLASMPQEHWDNALQKRINTCLSTYGYENVGQVPEIIDSITNTISARYGVKRYSQLDSWKEKTISSNLDRYGKEWYAQTEEFLSSVANTLQTTYHENVVNAFQLSSSIIKGNKKRYRKYKYDNKIIDSMPEIAYYVWLTDNNIEFEYHPTFANFKYKTHDNKIRTYCPDFYIKNLNRFVEIKGDQFFDENGKFKDPYNKKFPEDTEAKYKCMIDNNVQILRNNDYKFFIIYVEKMYGNNYLQQFRI